MATARGGANLARKLDAISRRIAKANSVSVGFLEDAAYPAVEPGAGRLLKGLDKLNSTGPFQKGQKPGRVRKYNKQRKEKLKTFVGPAKPAVALHVAQVAWWNEKGNARIPPRPFFSNMIAAGSPTWGKMLSSAVVKYGYDSQRALSLLGQHIHDQLVKSIVDWPADNAPLTVAIKGFNKGLIDQGIMQRSVDYVVEK